MYYQFHPGIKHVCALYFTKFIMSLQKCFNNIIIILVQSNGFDTANTFRGFTKTKIECILKKSNINIFKNFVTNLKDFQTDIKEIKNE